MRMEAIGPSKRKQGSLKVQHTCVYLGLADVVAHIVVSAKPPDTFLEVMHMWVVGFNMPKDIAGIGDSRWVSGPGSACLAPQRRTTSRIFRRMRERRLKNPNAKVVFGLEPLRTGWPS